MKKILTHILEIVAALSLMWMLCVEDPGILDVAIPGALLLAVNRIIDTPGPEKPGHEGPRKTILHPQG